jgi:hypothetical protein
MSPTQSSATGEASTRSAQPSATSLLGTPSNECHGWRDASEVKSRLEGFAVYAIRGVHVSIKNCSISTVDNESTSPFPRCPEPRVGLKSIKSDSGEWEPQWSTTHFRWSVFQDGDRYAVYNVRASANPDYGTDEICCISGDATQANTVTPMLRKDEVDLALNACIEALRYGCHHRQPRP